MALSFPFPTPPESGEVVEITDQIKWVRTPLPLSLDHINCYLIKDVNGWCIVDTGMNAEVTRDHWLDIIETHLGNEPITRVIVTHQHPDHVGLAGWLCRQFNAQLWMSESEYVHSRMWYYAKQAEPYWEVQQFFKRTAMDQRTLDGLVKFNTFTDSVYEMPTCYHRLADGQQFSIGDYQWQAITTRGHSPEHLSLYCAELDLYISGDQVLPKITSNVSITSYCPDASPLTDWLQAHDKIQALVPDSVLVLPAHEKPFLGLHERLNAVVAHHEDRLNQLLGLCKKPQNAQALTNQLFDRKLDSFQNYLAVGECLAHLHYLMEQGKIERMLDEETYLFCSVSLGTQAAQAI